MLSVVRGLGDVVAYKCSRTICYGSDGGATHALFKETQYQMNRVGAATFGTSWTAIAVDGFIGSGTVAAAKKLFPKLIALQKYAAPTSFGQLADWVSKDHSIPVTLRDIADKLRPSTVQPASTIENRISTYTKEGPAAGSVPPGPVVTIPSPDVSVPPTSQQPGFWPTPAAPGSKGKGFVWVVVGLAGVGLIATAAMVVRKRRRR